MGAETAIGWCDSTFNPWWGCVEVSAECDRCYARAWATFTGHPVWGKEAPRRFFGDQHWDEPLRWNRAAERDGTRRRVFCASMADVLEERDDEVGRQLDQARRRLWSLVARTPHLEWILLTKRAGALARLIPPEIRALPNVWPGVTCGDPASWWRVEKLAALDCAGPRWVSAEPLLGPLDFAPVLSPRSGGGGGDGPGSLAGHQPPGPGISWVITGGESGPGHRLMELAWLEALAAACEAAGVPLFVKQDSGPKPRQQGRIPDALWARKAWPR